MKKILAIALVLSLPLNAFAGSYIDKQLRESKKNEKYQTVKIHTQTINNIPVKPTYKKITDIKDPKLIKLSQVTPVDEKLYEQKLAADELIYEKDIKPLINKKLTNSSAEPIAVDLYKIYRVAERIIRANNLGYMNWRIALAKDTENVNAYATDANLIVIYTALYDSVYTNDDALAMVIAHEMAHNILGHAQRQAEMVQKLQEMCDNSQITNNQYSNNADATANLINTSSMLAYMKYMSNEMKDMEFMADTEGLSLLIKAGYDPHKATYTLKFLEAMPNVKKFFATHPIAAERLECAKENILMANPYWAEEGKVNIYNSDVLSVKRSSDKVSIVINSDEKLKTYYTPEDLETKLTRLAYLSYTKGNMQDAEKYFKKLLKIKNTYINNLYLSYVNEYLYKQTQSKRYQKRAQKAIEQAYILNPNDKYVKEQRESL